MKPNGSDPRAAQPALVGGIEAVGGHTPLPRLTTPTPSRFRDETGADQMNRSKILEMLDAAAGVAALAIILTAILWCTP